jgi:uncharacterized coiled-coil protein SlyX
MNATATEEIITDYQFRTILKMALYIAENTDDVEKIKKSLRELIGETRPSEESEEKPRDR